MRKHASIAAMALALLAGPAQAQISDGIVQIGVLDVPNSGVALAVNQITRDKGKAFIVFRPIEPGDCPLVKK